jgi:hypothetical protein
MLCQNKYDSSRDKARMALEVFGTDIASFTDETHSVHGMADGRRRKLG